MSETNWKFLLIKLLYIQIFAGNALVRDGNGPSYKVKKKKNVVVVQMKTEKKMFYTYIDTYGLKYEGNYVLGEQWYLNAGNGETCTAKLS